MLKDFTKWEFDIFIQAGQSNSRGYGFGEVEEPYWPNDLVWSLNDNFTISLAVEDVTLNAIQSNLTTTFSQEYVRNGLLKHGRKLLFIRAAAGGTGFLDNRWIMTGDLYLRMMDMIRTALELNENNRLVGLIWHQGETDALLNASYDVHYKNLMGLLKSVREEFNVPELPFIAGDFVQHWKSENVEVCKPVVNAIRDVCKDCGNGYFVESIGLKSNWQEIHCNPLGWEDHIHFSRKSIYFLGRRYFEGFYRIISNDWETVKKTQKKVLKEQILNKVPSYDRETIEWTDFDEFLSLVEEKDGFKVYDKALQAALDTCKCVKINNQGETIYLDNPLIMKGGYKLLVDKEQRISNVPGASHCLIRNYNIEDGYSQKVLHRRSDIDIVVEGGIWDGACEVGKSLKFDVGMGANIKGAMGIMIFSNVEQLVIRGAKFCNGGSNYAVQISNTVGFHVSDLQFIAYKRDGVHLNGPVSYGEVCNLSGVNMGDDIVALNAWDWDTSTISFGTIAHVYVHDIESKNGTFRLLPGKKMYENSYVDCDIHHCIIERVAGINTFKMYVQPNIMNAINKNYHDESGNLGDIYTLYFDEIVMNERNANEGLFEICSDCWDIHLENITITYMKDEFKKHGMCLVKVGPLSGTWKNHSDNPEDWGELFVPDAVCSVLDIYFKNIKFLDGERCSKEDLIREIYMKVNENYPVTIPKGGTGYGIVKKVYIED